MVDKWPLLSVGQYVSFDSINQFQDQQISHTKPDFVAPWRMRRRDPQINDTKFSKTVNGVGVH